jgi:hypothetical protein
MRIATCNINGINGRLANLLVKALFEAGAMFGDRRICVALYTAIVKLRPDWHSDDDKTGAKKIVMTGSAADPQGWQPHIGKGPPRQTGEESGRPAESRHPVRYVADRL